MLKCCFTWVEREIFAIFRDPQFAEIAKPKATPSYTHYLLEKIGDGKKDTKRNLAVYFGKYSNLMEKEILSKVGGGDEGENTRLIATDSSDDNNSDGSGSDDDLEEDLDFSDLEGGVCPTLGT